MKESIKFLFRDLLNKWFWIYITLFVFFLIAFKFITFPAIKVLSIFLLVFAQFLYTYHLKSDDLNLRLSKYLGWTYFGILLFFAVGYTAVLTNDKIIIVLTLLTLVYSSLIAVLSIFIAAASICAVSLWVSKKPLMIFLSYLFLVFTVLVTFGYLYAISHAFNIGEIKSPIDDTKVTNAWSFVYFSALIFYSSAFGDVIPYGFSKVIVILQLFFSVIVHVFILGRAVTSLEEYYQGIKLKSKK